MPFLLAFSLLFGAPLLAQEGGDPVGTGPQEPDPAGAADADALAPDMVDNSLPGRPRMQVQDPAASDAPVDDEGGGDARPDVETDTDADADVGEAAPAAAAPETKPAPPGLPLGQIGIGMAASGAALAVGGAVTAALVEALTRPDLPSEPQNETADRFKEVSGVGGVLVAAVSTVLLVAGAGLILTDALPAPTTGPAQAADPAGTLGE